MRTRIACFAGFALLIFILGLAGQWVNPWLSWDRYEINQLQVWRLITGHIVHTNVWHTSLNLSVLIAAMLLFGASYKAREWLVIFFVLCVSDSIGLYFFSPWLANYVGLSGVLYGILAVGLLKTICRSPIPNTIVFVFIAGKIIWEQMPGFDVNYLWSEIGSAVIVDAHLYGFVSGVCLYLLSMAWNKYKGEK